MRKSFVKVTNKGSVVKVVREHYLRDDIPCGVEGCSKCAQVWAQLPVTPVMLSSTEPILIPDTNLFLHFLDVFESSHFHNVVVLQTVLDEVRHHNQAIYNKIRNLVQQPHKRFFVFTNEHHRGCHVDRLPGESDNDRNDRAIRQSALFYMEHLDGQSMVTLLTNDHGNRERALRAGLKAVSLLSFVEASGDAELVDVMERSRREDIHDDGDGDDNNKKSLRQCPYSDYLPMSQLHAGIKEGRLLQGTLRVSHYDCYEGTVQTGLPSGSELSTVFISGRQCMNRAMNGDVVVVSVLPRDQWTAKGDTGDDNDNEDDRVGSGSSILNVDTPLAVEEQEAAPQANLQSQPKAKVVGVLRRSGRSYCGSIDKRSVKPGSTTQSVLFIAMDRRCPRIRLRTRQADHLAGQRVIVTMDDWPTGSSLPQGHLVKQLGVAGDRQTETEAILLEHDVAHDDFTPAVMSCLPGADWAPQCRDYEEREDFRHLTVCSVDPPGCTDIDDALHALPLPDGHIEVGVHIADVTHFVQAGTALDKEAASRATTVYLVDRRIDMLPSLLGTNLCSLKADVERFAFSVIWTLDRQANIKSVRFAKSIIKSRASLTYDEAQARLDSPDSDSDTVTHALKMLNQLAIILKQRRIDAGALTLASPEVRFTIDRQTSTPTDVEVKEQKAANSMVEEFMLLANISVAQHLHRAFPDNALLRRHPAPPQENFTSLNHAIEALGQPPLDTSSSRQLALSLDRITVPSDPHLNKLIRIMTTRCMQQAVYFASGTLPDDQFWHYGLASPIYTHFTSPIRRYADVLVHRLLANAIHSSQADASGLLAKEALEESCHNLNYRNRMAQQAQRSSVELFTHIYFKEQRKGEPIEEYGYVVRVMDSGFVVLLADYGIEGVLPKPDHPNVVYDAVKSMFKDAETGASVVYLFQRVKVKAVVEENEATGRPKLRFSLLQ